MAKDPAFLFYPGDWLGGTIGMTFEEKGAYLELLVMQWNCHRITEDDAKKLVGKKLWARIKRKFLCDNDGFFNQRLQDEKDKRKAHSDKQKANAEKRWHKSGNAMALPLENINENGIGINTLLLRKEIEDAIFKDERFVIELSMNHPKKDIRGAWNDCWTHHIQSPNPPTVAWIWKQKLNTWLINIKTEAPRQNKNKFVA